MRKRWENIEYKNRMLLRMHNEESERRRRNKISKTFKKLWGNSAYKEKMRIIRNDPRVATRISQSLRKYYKEHPEALIRVKSSEYAKLMSSSMRRQYREGTRKIGPFVRGTVNSIKGGVVSFRSSWEREFVKLLDASSVVKKFVYEPFGIQYKLDGHRHTYFPDFLITFVGGLKVLVELRGIKGSKSRWAKTLLEALKIKCKVAGELCAEKGYKFLLLYSVPKSISELLVYGYNNV